MKMVSIHIPKSGGVNFGEHLDHIYGENNVVHDYNHTDRPGYTSEPIDKNVMKRLRDTDSQLIIHGHFFMSKYANIPNVKRIVWFRNPVERLCSHYYFWMKLEDKEHHNWGLLHKKGLSLLDFAKIKEIRNYYTMFLDGVRISAFDFVGSADSYSDSLDLFYEMFAPDKYILDIHRNKNSGKSEELYPLSNKLRRKLESINREDMFLYEKALKRYERLRSSMYRFWT